MCEELKTNEFIKIISKGGFDCDSKDDIKYIVEKLENLK